AGQNVHHSWRFAMRRILAVGTALGILFSTPSLRGQPRDATNSVGMKLIRIDPGVFVMGSGSEPPHDRQMWEARDWDEAPAHRVKISKAFFLGACEITNAQYE